MGISKEGVREIAGFIGAPFSPIGQNPNGSRFADGPQLSAEIKPANQAADALTITRKSSDGKDVSCSVQIAGTRAGLIYGKDRSRRLVVKNPGMTIVVTSRGKILRWEH